MEVSHPSSEFGNYPAHGEHVEPLNRRNAGNGAEPLNVLKELQFPVSIAIKPFDGLRAGSLNDLNGLQYA